MFRHLLFQRTGIQLLLGGRIRAQQVLKASLMAEHTGADHRIDKQRSLGLCQGRIDSGQLPGMSEIAQRTCQMSTGREANGKDSVRVHIIFLGMLLNMRHGQRRLP